MPKKLQIGWSGLTYFIPYFFFFFFYLAKVAIFLNNSSNNTYSKYFPLVHFHCSCLSLWINPDMGIICGRAEQKYPYTQMTCFYTWLIPLNQQHMYWTCILSELLSVRSFFALACFQLFLPAFSAPSLVFILIFIPPLSASPVSLLFPHLITSA